MKAQGLGRARVGPCAGAGDEPLRRQHLVRRARALGRLHPDPRRGHRHPRPRGRHRAQAAEGQHPAHPPPPRPHPGADVLRALLPLGVRDHHLGPGLARGLAGGADRALHLRPALPRRGARAALRRLVPRHPGDRVGDRPRHDPGRGGDAPRPHPRLPDHRRRHDAHLHPGPRAGPRRAAGDAGAGVDLRLRPRPPHRPPDPRLPVQRRRVPGPRRLGALASSATPSPSRAGSRRDGCCSSTTTRCTPTSSSTASARPRPPAGRSSAEQPARWSWPSSARSSRCWPPPQRSPRRRRPQATPGRRSAQGRSASSWAARESSVSSPLGGAASCTDSGRPSELSPAGTEAAGWPVWFQATA